MAAAKIKTSWDEDIYGDSILLVEKSRGKLNLEEVADAIRYNWQLQGHYIMMINATEATCGADWDPFGELEKQGDMWELYRIEEMEKCPVCKRITPFLHCCPECGKDLIAKEDAERGIRSKSKALLDAIIRTNLVQAQDEEGCLRIIDGILKDMLK